MNALTIENVASLDGILGDFLKKADAELTVVIDRGGNVISQFGDVSVMDVTIIAALAAGSFAATKELVEFVWQPDRVERRARYRGLELSSVTIVPFKQMSVAVSLTIENKQNVPRKTEIKLALNGGVTKSVTPWNAAAPSSEGVRNGRPLAAS